MKRNIWLRVAATSIGVLIALGCHDTIDPPPPIATDPGPMVLGVLSPPGDLAAMVIEFDSSQVSSFSVSTGLASRSAFTAGKLRIILLGPIPSDAFAVVRVRDRKRPPTPNVLQASLGKPSGYKLVSSLTLTLSSQ